MLCRDAFNSEEPNTLVYWSFMKEIIRDGISILKLGRCTSPGGPHRTKQQSGGQDELLPWAQWSSAGVATTALSENLRYCFVAAVWQWDLWTLRLGPRLARSLP